MNFIYLITPLFLFLSCSNRTDESINIESNSKTEKTITMEQSDLTNDKMKSYSFLVGMYYDSYFPDFLVDKIKSILVELCADIENRTPNNLDELYELTHKSTNEINDLEDEFYANESEIETVAREVIAEDFEFISIAYGFEADIEELIATRDW